MDDTMFIDFPLIFHCWSLEPPDSISEEIETEKYSFSDVMAALYLPWGEIENNQSVLTHKKAIYLINCHHCELDVIFSIDYVKLHPVRMSHNISKSHMKF